MTNVVVTRQCIDVNKFATSVGLKTILRYSIQNLVPSETGTTYKELVEKTSVLDKKLTRLLRHGITDHFF
jgi:hypothetical protein